MIELVEVADAVSMKRRGFMLHVWRNPSCRRDSRKKRASSRQALLDWSHQQRQKGKASAELHVRIPFKRSHTHQFTPEP